MEMQRKGTLVACVLSRQPPPTKPAPIREVGLSPSFLQTTDASGAGRERREKSQAEGDKCCFVGLGGLCWGHCTSCPGTGSLCHFGDEEFGVG